MSGRKKNSDPESLTTIRTRVKTINELRSVESLPNESNESIIHRLVIFFKKWSPKVKKRVDVK